MDTAIADAVKIMAEKADELEKVGKYGPVVQLSHAIRHIVRPERDVYPKVRDSRKSHPTTRDGAYKWKK